MPALATLLAILVRSFTGRKIRVVILASASILLVIQTWSIRSGLAFDSDWRTTAELIRRELPGPSKPVLVRTGFTEAKHPDRRRGHRARWCSGGPAEDNTGQHPAARLLEHIGRRRQIDTFGP